MDNWTSFLWGSCPEGEDKIDTNNPKVERIEDQTEIARKVEKIELTMISQNQRRHLKNKNQEKMKDER